MHDEQTQFVATVREVLPQFFADVSVLEVGSYDVNGSIRGLFEPRRYLGLDLIEGPGVDLVCPGHRFVSAERFDVAISTECFEHNPDWRQTFLRMAAQVRPGGLVAVTCASEGRPVHGTSDADPASSPGTVQTGSEYYRNLTEADFADIDLAALFANWVFAGNRASHDLYFVGLAHGDEMTGAADALARLGRLCAANEQTSLALHRAIELLQARQADAAVQIAQAALDSAQPACTEQAARILGWALRMAGRLEDSETALRRALEIAPTPDGLFHLALTLRGRGVLDEARAAAKRAAELRPGFAPYEQLVGLLTT